MARLYAARGAGLNKKMTGGAKKSGREVNSRRTKLSDLSAKVSNLKPSARGRSSEDKSIQRDNGGRTRTRTLDPVIRSRSRSRPRRPHGGSGTARGEGGRLHGRPRG